MSGTATLEDDSHPWKTRARPDAPGLHLAIAWSLDEPWRIGETAEVAGPTLLGRGTPEPGDGATVARFVRWRPHECTRTAPLAGSRISREQLELRPLGDGTLAAHNVGRCKLLVNGEAASTAVLRPGDTLTLRNALVLVLVRRSPALAVLGGAARPPVFPFGGPDPYGLVGESGPAWRLRAELAFAASTDHHVLLRGPSGVGKELAARALHAMSSRASRPLVARNAATLPEGLVDVELFGAARNYPNVGSPERTGLIGEADGSFLFLDEIGELAPTLQAHLLRVLDHGGEYQRLGEPRLRRADLRLIAATNRELAALKHDFAARFTSRIELPGLDARREDIPLLFRAILRRAAAQNPAVAPRFFLADGEPRIDPGLIERLLRHRFTHHTRELERLAWRSIATSPGEFIDLTPEVDAELGLSGDAAPPVSAAAAPVVASEPPGRDAIVAALADASGSATVAAERLGLRNRYVLYRLMKKYGIQTADE